MLYVDPIYRYYIEMLYIEMLYIDPIYRYYIEMLHIDAMVYLCSCLSNYYYFVCTLFCIVCTACCQF